MTDGCAAQIAAGALEVGSWNSVLGTTLVLKGVTRELIRDPAGVMYSHRSPTATGCLAAPPAPAQPSSQSNFQT